MQLDEPRALCVRENVTLSPDVSELVFLVLCLVSATKNEDSFTIDHTISDLTRDLRA